MFGKKSFGKEIKNIRYGFGFKKKEYFFLQKYILV